MKLAVIFPGIGYHTDKPLLYFAKKLVQACGYETVEVPYGNFPAGVKGSLEKMEAAFYSALAQTEELLKDIDFSKYDSLLFVSKSIGTAVASAYAGEHGLKAHHVYYTPVEQTFSFVEEEGGVVFHGTKDPWVETDVVKKACEEKKLPLFITQDANHSLETGDVFVDLENLKYIMEETRKYLERLEADVPDGMTQDGGAPKQDGGMPTDGAAHTSDAPCGETAQDSTDSVESYLIRDTTREQRERIVRDSLGYSEVGCEDCMDGYEMYLPYIEGKKELKEITMEYRTRYLKDMEREERGRCAMW